MDTRVKPAHDDREIFHRSHLAAWQRRKAGGGI